MLIRSSLIFRYMLLITLCTLNSINSLAQSQAQKQTTTNTFTGSKNSNWNRKKNWSRKEVPTQFDEVTIPCSKTVKTSKTSKAYSLNIAANAKMVVGNNTLLTVKHNLNIANKGNLEVNEEAVLIVEKDVTNSGSFKGISSSKKYANIIIKGDYQKIGNGTFSYNGCVAGTSSDLKTPPVALTLSDLVTQNPDMPLMQNPNNLSQYAIGTYDNVTQSYGALDNDIHGATMLTPGIGYRMRAKSGDQKDNLLYMSGEPRTGDIAVPINYKGDTWNLVGNPYTSCINVRSFLDANANKFDDHFYGVYGWNGKKWKIYNKNDNKWILPPTQGFFVAAKLNGTVVFNSSMQTTANGDDFIKNRSASDNSSITVSIKAQEDTDDTVIYFNPYGTAGFDIGYDSNRFNHGDASQLGIYTSYANNFDDSELGIQTLPDALTNEAVIPLGVVTSTGGTHTISIENTLNNTSVYLEDRDHKIWHDLSQSSFSFDSPEALSGTGRFFIHTRTEALNHRDQKQDHIKLTVAHKTVSIHRQNKTPLLAQVYDLNGRLILSRTLNKNQNSFTVNTPKGVYVVSLESQTSKTNFKILIN